ncbi:hypothetical protein [Paraburkholderia acidisoli]|uniref:hypothetical protein n=1 Tax=Paraburkholderia acidisoli TaxID=2571748 RepID=UPI0018EECF19|nr:hypothetical protein [Paraburkholderia acidisoli]
MVVAVVAVRMVQMPVDEIIDVIAMRHGFVPAARSVHMPGLMAARAVSTGIGVLVANLDLVLIDVVAMRVMQMTVMQIVDVITMLDGRMAASRAVLVVMMGVMRFVAACAHVSSLAVMVATANVSWQR